MDNAERRHLFRALRRAGWTIRVGGSGHYKLRNPAGQLITTAPASPSDWRGRHALLADLRRAGFDWKQIRRR